jgi:hypothetical protein
MRTRISLLALILWGSGSMGLLDPSLLFEEIQDRLAHGSVEWVIKALCHAPCRRSKFMSAGFLKILVLWLVVN